MEEWRSGVEKREDGAVRWVPGPCDFVPECNTHYTCFSAFPIRATEVGVPLARRQPVQTPTQRAGWWAWHGGHGMVGMVETSTGYHAGCAWRRQLFRFLASVGLSNIP